ncbi:MAG: hypothetical protein HOH33_12600 [Verrucomicrobia bacterium]|jgi:tetratricopeptide (TPR) repeat protein|nr:hypothetical protein [Verrucomicrobiota bacterium]
MSIGPNESFPFDPDSNINPGDIVLTMLDGILEEQKKVTDHDQMEASNLLDQALETEDVDEAVEFMLKALEHDPANVDVHLEFLEIACVDDEYQIPVLQRLEAIAKKKLGEDLFNQAKGHFWMMHETRPYMRVLECLATECHYQDRIEEAVKHWEAMLQLNPNDNQGVRSQLLLSYLDIGQLNEADKLFAQYDDIEISCCFSWGKVLRCLLDQNDNLATQALRVARKQNRYMESFIKGTRKPPLELPDQYALGSKEEAVCFVDFMTSTWNKYPDAIQWLKQQQKK